MGISTARAIDRSADLQAQPGLGQETRQALMVLGMHRSGTSALTRVLALCGAALPRHRMAPAQGNPLGHWEPQPIVDAHDRFLAEAGTGWDATADYPGAIFNARPAADCRRALTELAVSEYGDAPLFILKDPRISRLMPLWRPVLNELGVAPRIVIMVRNPLEVAGSLERRNRWGEHRALIVWLRYLLAAERDTRDLTRCFVGYSQLMTDWRSVVDTISRQLGIAFPARSRAIEQEIDSFVRPELRHHRHRTDALFQRADIADCVKQAYRCFSDAAETGTVDQGALDGVARALDDAEDALERMTRRRTRPAPADAGPAAPDSDGTLTALMLAELERANDTAELSQRTLREFRATRSWRLTKPLRALGRTVDRVLGRQV
jgi:hypothetical protein